MHMYYSWVIAIYILVCLGVVFVWMIFGWLFSRRKKVGDKHCPAAVAGEETEYNLVFMPECSVDNLFPDSIGTPPAANRSGSPYLKLAVDNSDTGAVDTHPADGLMNRSALILPRTVAEEDQERSKCEKILQDLIESDRLL